MRVRSVRRPWAWVPALLPLLGGCNIMSAPVPQEARVVVQASVAEPLLLIVASEFTRDAAGHPSPSNIQAADTFLVARPYEATFSLESGQLLVRLENASDAMESARLEVFLDGKTTYDAAQDLNSGEFLQYAYRNLAY